MAYSDKVWKDSPDHTTPLSAAGLNDWEARIKAETDALSVLVGSKAPSASPALTGHPTAPTQAAGSASTDLATTAYTDRAVAVLQRPLPTTVSLLPPGVKVSGVNLVISPAQSGYDGYWSTLWGTWPWTQLKAQIDKSRLLGANCVRLIGGLGAIKTGTITLQTYVDRLEQLVSYCASQGMYVQGCASALGHLNGASQADVIAYSTAQLAMCERYPNVIAFDLSNEIIGEGTGTGLSEAQCIAYAGAMYAALKPLTKIPLGFSHSYGWNDSRVASFAAYCDYHDFHVYPVTTGVPDPLDIDTMMAADPGKPLLIGEYGIPLSESSGDRAAFYRAVRELVQRPGVDGALAWSAVDQAATPDSLRYGLFPTEVTGVRSTIGDVFATFPRRATPWTYLKPLGSSVTLNGSTGSYSAIHSVTTYCPVPCRVDIDFTFDLLMASPAGNIFDGLVQVDGVAVDAAHMYAGAVGRQVVNRSFSQIVSIGSHTFASYVARLVGSDTSSSVQSGATTALRLTFTPL